MKDLNKYGRNNRECIAHMDNVHNFFDFGDPEDFYLCNDMLNISHIKEGDLIKFRLKDTDNEFYKVYGCVMMAINQGHTTFIVCIHYNDNGKQYVQDYKYSSFLHAFEKLNNVKDIAKSWESITHMGDVKTPKDFYSLWINYNDRFLTRKYDDYVEYEDIKSDVEPVNTDIRKLQVDVKKIHAVIDMLSDRITQLENMHPSAY